MESYIRVEIDNAISEIGHWQELLTSEERLNLWSEIMEGYCKNCGDKTGKEKCHCANDE